MNSLLLSCFIVLITVLSVLVLERIKKPFIKLFLQWIPPILFAYIIPALITHLWGLDLAKESIHQWSKQWIIPLVIITIMGSMSLKALRIVGVKPIILFVSGSFVIALLPILLLAGVNLVHGNDTVFFTDDYWKGLVPMVGSWIGGSTSMLVLKEYVGTSEQLFLSVLVLDNILVNIWTILMFQFIRNSKRINRYLGLKETKVIEEEKVNMSNKSQKIGVTLLIVISSLFGIQFFNLPFLWTIISLSILGILLANFIPFWHHQINLKIGSVGIVVVMAILGLKLNFENFHLPFLFVGVVIVWLLAQFILSMALCYVLKLSMVWVPIANMANLGGISTAPAVTAAYQKSLMPHAIVLAILSMITGTFWGIITTFFITTFIL